jgi:hypothetical protein
MLRARTKLELMRSIAIERVLSGKMDRAEIGSLAGLLEKYRAELAANYSEIEARAGEIMA